VAALGDDLFPKDAPFALYALPPESFAGISGGGISRVHEKRHVRTTAIEYLYRP